MPRKKKLENAKRRMQNDVSRHKFITQNVEKAVEHAIELKGCDALSTTTASSWQPPADGDGSSSSSSSSSSGGDSGGGGHGAAAPGQFAGKRLPTATKQPAMKRPRYGDGSGGRNGNINGDNDDVDDTQTRAGDMGW